MPYDYEVFLSYRRHREWAHWVRNDFLPLFEHYLGEELAGSGPKIFFDVNDIETGTAWPWKLANALARSKILVCLWSRQYFSSPWCKAELSYMRARENRCRFGTLEKPEGLIVPVIIHDGEDLPAEEKITEPLRLADVVNVRMAPGSRKAEELAERIEKWAPDVARAVHRAPDFDEEWQHLAAAVIGPLFRPPQAQTSVPSLDA